MDYRTPEGNIIKTSTTLLITITTADGERQFPSTILDKKDPAVLDQYGYRRIIYGPKEDNRFWINTPASDISTPGVEIINYTASPRFTSAEAQTRLVDAYYNRTQPVVEEINKRIDVYTATGQAGKLADWQAHLAGVQPAYDSGVAAFQAAMALPTEEERYAALIDIFINMDNYIYTLPET